MALNLDRPAAAAWLGRLGVPQHQGDILLALGVSGIIVVLIPPMPRLPLDDLLAVSITFSVLVLLTALSITRPLDFSAFPTVLLVATLLRVASTSPRPGCSSRTATSARPPPGGSSRCSAASSCKATW